METTVRPAIISGLVGSAGCTVIAGDAKFGKSTLAMEMVAAVTRGEPFLERYPVQQGGAVYWMADDPSVERFQRNYRIVCGSAPLPNFAGMVDRRKLSPESLSELRRTIKQVSAKLVVIDSFTAIRALRDRGADFVAAEYDEMRMLSQVGREHECAVMVIHHMASSGRGLRGVNVFNNFAGSFGVTAGPDNLLAVTILSMTRTERLLTAAGRDIAARLVLYGREPATERLFVIADGSHAETWTLAMEVYRMTDGLPFTGAEVGEKLGLTKRAGQHRAATLRAAGFVEEIGDRRLIWTEEWERLLKRVDAINRTEAKP